jgi:hypothetical protein
MAELKTSTPPLSSLLLAAGPSLAANQCARFRRSSTPQSRQQRLVAVWFGAPVELDGNAILKRVGRFPEFFPFLSFRQPVVHLSFGDCGAFPTHAFLHGKTACRPHDTSPLTAYSARGERKSGLELSANVPLPYPQVNTVLWRESCDSAVSRELFSSYPQKYCAR